jgi:hypothetical protein
MRWLCLKDVGQCHAQDAKDRGSLNFGRMDFLACELSTWSRGSKLIIPPDRKSSILYANDIPAALAGPPTAAFYGSDTLWIILVSDTLFEDACNILGANIYDDALMDQNDCKSMQPPGKAVKWRVLSPKYESDGAVIFAPASHWHFEVTDDTTIVVDCMRLTEFSSYLQGEWTEPLPVTLYSRHLHFPALVSLLIQRLQSSIYVIDNRTFLSYNWKPWTCRAYEVNTPICWRIFARR